MNRLCGECPAFVDSLIEVIKDMTNEEKTEEELKTKMTMLVEQRGVLHGKLKKLTEVVSETESE